MLIFLGLMTVAGGLFLLLWYRTVVSLPVGVQPPFIHSEPFKWGIPAISAVVMTAGLYLLSQVDYWLAGAVLAGAILLSFLVVRHDRYSAELRIIHDHYRKLRAANRDMEEMEILYHTAKWRYPRWSHDRLVELVAGKDIGGLMLLMLVADNKINPISDWELYRSLKSRVEKMARTAP
jgi:hypothetical protein